MSKVRVTMGGDYLRTYTEEGRIQWGSYSYIYPTIISLISETHFH